MSFFRCVPVLYTGLLVVTILGNGNGWGQEHPVFYRNTASANLEMPADTGSIKRILQQLGALRYASPDSFRLLSELALRQSRQAGYQTGIYESLNKLGLYYRDRGLHDTAIALFRKAIPYARSANNENKMYILYNNIGNSYFNLGRYEWALENFYRALAVSGLKNTSITTEDSTGIFINIGVIWGALREKERSLNTFLTAQRLAVNTGDTAMLIAICINLGTLLVNNGDWRDAEFYFKKALHMTQVRKDTGHEIYAYTCLARLYLQWRMPENAMTHIRQASVLLETYPASADLWLDVQAMLGAVYLGRQDYAKAHTFLLTALERAAEGNLKDKMIEIEPNVATMYAATGDYRKAYAHMLHYARIKDTLLEYEKGKTMDIWMQAQMSEKDEELMAQQLRISIQKSQLHAKNTLVTGTVAGAILLLTALAALLRSYRHRQKLQQAAMLQLRQEQEINQLKAQVRGEEQERNRIAQELHDGIASQLWAIKLNIDTLQQQPDGTQQQSLQVIYQQLEDTTQDVRKTAHNLMPDLLLQEGLATALASLCEKTGKNTRLEVDFLEYGIIPRMDPDIELSLYRMIQELIQNALKHAGNATQLLVQLSCSGSLLNITVEDNGVGFTQEESTGGMGLEHIRRRVQALQGHIDIQSMPGKGTTIYLEFDIQHLL